MKETVGGIVTLEVLQMRGKFTKKDIFDKVVPKIKKYFSNKEEMEKYIEKKIKTLVEYCLIGRTGVYFLKYRSYYNKSKLKKDSIKRISELISPNLSIEFFNLICIECIITYSNPRNTMFSCM